MYALRGARPRGQLNLEIWSSRKIDTTNPTPNSSEPFKGSSQTSSALFSPLEAYPAYANHLRKVNKLGTVLSNANKDLVASTQMNKQLWTPYALCDFSYWDIYPYTDGKPCPIWITEEKKLQDLTFILQNEPEFAMDVHYHAVDGKIGFISLITISTWHDGDFLIDPLPLFEVIQEELKPILECEIITKVMYNSTQAIHQFRKCFNTHMVRVMDASELYYEMSNENYVTFRELSSALYPEHKKLLSIDEAHSDFCRRGDDFSENQGAFSINKTHFLLRVFDQMIYECLHEKLGRRYIWDAFERSKSNLNKIANGGELDSIEISLPLVEQLKDCWDQFVKSINNFTKIRKSEKNLLKLLIEWRFHFANMAGADAQKILSTKNLLAIAREKPGDEKGLRKIMGPHFTAQIKKQSDVLLNLIKDGEKYMEDLRFVQCSWCLGFFHTASSCRLQDTKSIFYYLRLDTDLKTATEPPNFTRMNLEEYRRQHILH